MSATATSVLSAESCNHRRAMSLPRAYRAGESLEDLCRVCKVDRLHTVIVVDAEGAPIRVVCGYCHSEHNYRGGPGSASIPTTGIVRRGTRHPACVLATGRHFPSSAIARGHQPCLEAETPADLELLLRRIIREETGITPVVPADKWRGGTLVLRPGTAGAAGEDVAHRDVLPQGRHAAESSSHARAAGQRLGPAGRRRR